MTLNLKNLLNPKVKMSKMGEFQELQPIEGLELSAVSADLYGDGRDDLTLFYFKDGANYAAVYTTSKVTSASINWNLKMKRNFAKALMVNTKNANTLTGTKGAQGLKEVAQALVKLCHKVDIATRLIIDDAWPQFSEPQDSYPGYENDLRILRFPCGGNKFLEKEKLWPYLDEFVNSLAVFYWTKLPNAATAHYADGGYCAFKLKLKTELPYTFTGH